MSTALLHRLLSRKPSPPTTLRMNVCPPDVCAPARGKLWNSALRWLSGDEFKPAPALRTPLERARSEFVDAMTGLFDEPSLDLLRRARHARSLRELWHLRSELYTLIARRISQQEADRRLATVNQHFPTRAQRTTVALAEVADAQ